MLKRLLRAWRPSVLPVWKPALQSSSTCEKCGSVLDGIGAGLKRSHVVVLGVEANEDRNTRREVVDVDLADGPAKIALNSVSFLEANRNWTAVLRNIERERLR